MTHGFDKHQLSEVDGWCFLCSLLSRKQWEAWQYEHGIAGGSPFVQERIARGMLYDHEQALIEHESRKSHDYFR